MTMRITLTAVPIVLVLTLAACAPKIYGTLQLMDQNMQPIPAAKEGPEGSVVNMINTTSTLEQASHAVTVNAEGKFESEKGKLLPGIYRVEASRIGFQTDTQTVEITKWGGKKVEFKLRKIAEGKRKSIEGSRSDEDKIVNPGEVNIQPPTM
jgi:heme/copper-type cytochrome/quinol oxidase subunit 2